MRMGGATPLLSLNELGEKSQATIIIGKFENKPQSNSYWLQKMFFVGQNLKQVHMTYF